MVAIVKPQYWTSDIYCAATLDCLGVPYLRTDVQEDGTVVFVFANVGDAAWKTAMEYRTDEWTLVPVLRYKASLRFLSRQSRAAQQVHHTQEISKHDNRTTA